MAIIIAKPIEREGQVDSLTLSSKYPAFYKKGNYLMVIVNRIFNEKSKIVLVPKLSVEVPLIEKKYLGVKIDLSKIIQDYGIPVGYYIELIATNFIFTTESGKEVVPIFPNEIELDCYYSITDIIKKDVEIIQKVAEVYEIIGKLFQAGMVQIARDLQEAIIRNEKGDFDGSIKFFRKVVEAFQKQTNEEILKSSNRVDAFKDYLKKVFHLLSNFGEHAGTEALMSEAVLAKELTISTTKYVIAKMEELKVSS